MKPRALDLTCIFCSKAMNGRSDKRFCSTQCAFRNRHGIPSERQCKMCGKTFPIGQRGDANRRYCSQVCSKKAHYKNVKTWSEDHPEAMPSYNRNRVAKNPGVYREKHRDERSLIIGSLGGECIVHGCGVTKREWLHVDYIPTTRNKTHRHPRHPRYILAHREDFRLLCANHHYELTLTGRIDGTEITQ